MPKQAHDPRFGDKKLTAGRKNSDDAAKCDKLKEALKPHLHMVNFPIFFGEQSHLTLGDLVNYDLTLQGHTKDSIRDQVKRIDKKMLRKLNS